MMKTNREIQRVIKKFKISRESLFGNRRTRTFPERRAREELIVYLRKDYSVKQIAKYLVIKNSVIYHAQKKGKRQVVKRTSPIAEIQKTREEKDAILVAVLEELRGDLLNKLESLSIVINLYKPK